MGVMHEADDAYSIQSTWSCYWLDQFLTLALNILILSIFYISVDLSTNYFAHFSGCWASFVCSCHSILECCVTFSGVKLSIRSFVLFHRCSRCSCCFNCHLNKCISLQQRIFGFKIIKHINSYFSFPCSRVFPFIAHLPDLKDSKTLWTRFYRHLKT